MKPFNLEGAIAGKPIRCRDDQYKAEFIAYKHGMVVCWVTSPQGLVFVFDFREDGMRGAGADHHLDLFMDTKTNWVRLYRRVGSLDDIFTWQAESDNDFPVQPGHGFRWISYPVEIELY